MLTADNIISRMNDFGFELESVKRAVTGSCYLSFKKQGNSFKIRLADHSPSMWRVMDSEFRSDLCIDVCDDVSSVIPFYFSGKKVVSTQKIKKTMSINDLLSITKTNLIETGSIFEITTTNNNSNLKVVKELQPSKKGTRMFECEVADYVSEVVYYQEVIK